MGEKWWCLSIKLCQYPCLEKDVGEKGHSKSQNREKIQGETDYLVDPFHKKYE